MRSFTGIASLRRRNKRSGRLRTIDLDQALGMRRIQPLRVRITLQGNHRVFGLFGQILLTKCALDLCAERDLTGSGVWHGLQEHKKHIENNADDSFW